MKKKILYFLLVTALASCKNREIPPETEVVASGTPVTVTTISQQLMQDYIELNATSAFLQKWLVRANATGYLQSANVQLNKPVGNGQVLFTMKTKEAESIGNSINILDTTLHFTGLNTIKANGAGFISQINHQPGDYVQEGEQLAVITDTKSFVFLLDLPFELRPYMQNKKTLELVLSDGEKFTATISGNMPSMDIAAQTQVIMLKINGAPSIPENLIAKVRLVKSSKENAQVLPKNAVLSNETQDEFWVMKMNNDSTAIKVNVKKGIETDNQIEIIAPVFSITDNILVTGNFGLEDTAKVIIMTLSDKKE